MAFEITRDNESQLYLQHIITITYSIIKTTVVLFTSTSVENTAIGDYTGL